MIIKSDMKATIHEWRERGNGELDLDQEDLADCDILVSGFTVEDM